MTHEISSFPCVGPFALSTQISPSLSRNSVPHFHIHPLFFERAIPTRFRIWRSLTTPSYPGKPPLYSLSLTPLSLKVPVIPIDRISSDHPKHHIFHRQASNTTTFYLHFRHKATPTPTLPLPCNRDNPLVCTRNLAIEPRVETRPWHSLHRVNLELFPPKDTLLAHELKKYTRHHGFPTPGAQHGARQREFTSKSHQAKCPRHT